MLVQGVVASPVGPGQPDGSNPVGLMGRQGDLLASELHGKYFNTNFRSNLFLASTAQAGVTIPLNAATLASVFDLVNPVGSGKNLELVGLDYTVTSTVVVNAIGLAYQSGFSSTAATGALTSITQGTIKSCIMGASLIGSIALFYTAATHAGTPTWFASLMALESTTVAGQPVNNYNFDGKVIVPPGTVVSVVASIGAQAGSCVNLYWSEWPT